MTVLTQSTAIITLRPFIKPCEERLDALLKRIDKLLKCVDLARQTSQQQVDKAQHHIVSLKTKVTSTFTKIRKKLARQEERLMTDLEKAAARVDKVASCTQDEQQLAEVNLESLRFLGQSLLTGDVYDQMSNLPNLEEAVEKRWRTEIPGVVWMEQSDQKEKNIMLPKIDHLTLTETAYTTSVSLHLEGESSGVNVSRLEEENGSDGEAHSEGGADSMTGASSKLADRLPSDSGDITKFKAGGNVTGLCLYNKTISLVKNDEALHVYSSTGDLMKRHVVNGMKKSWDVTVMTHDDGDKLIISSRDPRCLYYITVQSVGDTCTLGTTYSKQLDYDPLGLCVNDHNNAVVADQSNRTIHVYNSSGDEISTIKLPSSFTPVYLTLDHSGGYIITGGYFNQIAWIDGQGAEQRRHQDTACGITLSNPRGVVGDSENR